MKAWKQDDQRHVILASASEIRAKILRSAGIDFVVMPAEVDELRARKKLADSGCSTEEAAIAIAETKAIDVSHAHEGAFVIGADQLLEHDGNWLSKPHHVGDAARQLRRLTGKNHDLVSAVVVACAGKRVWHGVERARMTMRALPETTLSVYLEGAKEGIGTSVGGYRLEGEGIQLFENIEGDWFTMMGLPLLPLLAFLRKWGIIPP